MLADLYCKGTVVFGSVVLAVLLGVQRVLDKLPRPVRRCGCTYPYHHMYGRPSTLPGCKKLRCPACEEFAR